MIIICCYTKKSIASVLEKVLEKILEKEKVVGRVAEKNKDYYKEEERKNEKVVIWKY